MALVDLRARLVFLHDRPTSIFSALAFIGYLHRESKKTLNSCPQLPQTLTYFQNSDTVRLSGTLAINSYLNIPPHLSYIATLPCEISMFKKSPSSKSN